MPSVGSNFGGRTLPWSRSVSILSGDGLSLKKGRPRAPWGGPIAGGKPRGGFRRDRNLTLGPLKQYPPAHPSRSIRDYPDLRFARAVGGGAGRVRSTQPR